MKGKPLSRSREATLKAIASGKVEVEFTPRLARDIIAALEYERQRADEAETRALGATRELDAIRPSHWHD